PTLNECKAVVVVVVGSAPGVDRCRIDIRRILAVPRREPTAVIYIPNHRLGTAAANGIGLQGPFDGIRGAGSDRANISAPISGGAIDDRSGIHMDAVDARQIG